MRKAEADTLYNMEFHDMLVLDGGEGEIRVLRVPGGWVYGSTFVPFNNEFQNLSSIRGEEGRFVIVSRNRKNNKFGIVDMENHILKKDVEPILVRESDVVESMGFGVKYYTYSPSKKSYTTVFQFAGELRTIPNDRADDNIMNLPLIKE